MRNEKGSVLIASLWVLCIFAILVSSLAFASGQQMILMKREIENLEAKSDFLSGIYLTHQMILKDPLPHEDSLEDAWRGDLTLSEPWKDKVSVHVEDEESKVNLNTASENFLDKFLKLREEKENKPLESGRKNFIKQVIKTRTKDRIASLEELYLLEDVTKADVDRLIPYVTVYPDVPQMNVNTVSGMMLEAMIESVSGDDFAKEALIKKILEYRKNKVDGMSLFLLSTDLTPNAFTGKLGLRQSPQMMSLVNQLLPLVTTDSRTYRLTMKTKHKEAEAVIRSSETYKVEVMSYHEY